MAFNVHTSISGGSSDAGTGAAAATTTDNISALIEARKSQADVSPHPIIASNDPVGGLVVRSDHSVSISHQADGNTADHASSLNLVSAGPGSTSNADGIDASSAITMSASAFDCALPSSNALADATDDDDGGGGGSLSPFKPPLLHADAALLETHSSVATFNVTSGLQVATYLQTSRLTSKPDESMSLKSMGADLKAKAFLNANVKAHLGGVRIKTAGGRESSRVRFAATGSTASAGSGTVEVKSDIVLNLQAVRTAAAAAVADSGSGAAAESLTACVCQDGSVFAVPGDADCIEWMATHEAELATLCTVK